MLLFSDGFETFDIMDLRYKWGMFNLLYRTTSPKIVYGNDPSCNKPYATKNGRALYFGSSAGVLGTTFKPSRTVFVGVAVRSRPKLTPQPTPLSLQIDFYNKVSIDRGMSPEIYYNGNIPSTSYPSWGTPISTLTLTITNYRVAISWTFAGATTRIGDINTTADMLSGDYHYIQVGFTLYGNVSAQPRAWAEVRVGGRGATNYVFQDILTTLPDGTGQFFVNALTFQPTAGMEGTAIDDFYICNDEGSVNNSFLGNVKVRRVLPVADGTENDAAPTLKLADAARFQAVHEDFVGSFGWPPALDPADPLYLSPEECFEDYLSLERSGDRQLLRFTDAGFADSKPRIFGTILHPLAKAKYRSVAGTTTLTGVMKTGLLPILEANPADAPISHTRLGGGTWQTYPLVFENTEVVLPGQLPQIWNPDTINNSEFGFDLAACELDPIMYGGILDRFSLVTYEVVSDVLYCIDATHRFYEDPIADGMAFEETELSYEHTWLFTEELYWDVEVAAYNAFPRFINETLEFSESIPWTYLFAQDAIDLMDDVFIQWLDVVEDGFALDDWADGFWEELFTDEIGFADNGIFTYIELLDEMFGLEEPYLWDGHELIEEELMIDVDEPWDNHELLEETLHTDDGLAQGVGLDIDDTFGLEEDHHNGWLVEQPAVSVLLAESVRTQQWRYEKLFGMVINSWQIEPIEQVGQDGNHTGDNPWGA